MINLLPYYKKNVIDGQEVVNLLKEHDKSLSCENFVSNIEDDNENYLVEKHCFREGSSEFSELHPILLQAARLRNVVVFITRQHFFNVTGRNYTCDIFDDVRGKYLSYQKIEKYLKSIE